MAPFSVKEPMIFELSPAEAKKVKRFIKQEDKKCGGEYGAIGGGYTYHITPTSLGAVLKVENTVTKAVLNLTEYDKW